MSDNVENIGIKFKKTDGKRDQNLTLVKSYEGERFCVRNGHAYVIDEESDIITCQNCDKTFNPIWVLIDLCRKESKWTHNFKRYQEEMKRLANRKRTKCKSCGEMTDISRN